MKSNRFILMIGAAVILLGACGYFLAEHLRPDTDPSKREVLFYQDSMHPWIKSDRPGKCTVCLMDLTPIYEGDQGFGDSEDVIVLSSNTVTVLNVQTDEVVRRPLYRAVRAAGTLEADDTRKTIIGAPAPGRVDDVKIESAGVRVQRGQVLASFYSPDLSFQTRRYIFRDRITTREDMTARDNLLGSSRHTPHVTESTSSHPVPMSQQADPFYNDLLAPQSGIVVERNVYDGQYVAEGDRLFVIVDFSTLWFRFDVYEQQLPWLKPGQDVEVTVPAVPGRVFKATISIIEPSFFDATRTAKVRADVENPLLGEGENAQRLLRLGMYAEARIRAVEQDVLVAPRSAILFPGGQAYAYVDKGNGAYEMRQVQLGRQGDTDWEVLSGLEEGDQVVTSGNVLIDAQAQFTRSTWRGETEVATAASYEPPVDAPLQPGQVKALRNFLTVADGISTALASDDMPGLSGQLDILPEVACSLADSLQETDDWQDLVKRLRHTSHWPETKDLAAARKAFLPFSTNVVELVERVRSHEEAFRSLKVFFCPMAPKPGVWFQAKGPLRNPYYGAKMLSCGEEVKPKAVARSARAKAVDPSPGLAAYDSMAQAMKRRFSEMQPAETAAVASTEVSSTPSCCSASVAGKGDKAAEEEVSANSKPPTKTQVSAPAPRLAGRADVMRVPAKTSHYTNSGEALRMRMAHMPSRTKAGEAAPFRVTSGGDSK